jgi:putative FmdB family regulatory protein
MTYEYVCTACGNAWEAEQSISAAPLTDCPSCQSNSAKRQVSGGAGFILKGGGWYSDLYSSAPAKKSEDAGSTSAEAGSSTKKESGSADAGASKPKTDGSSGSGSGTSGSGTSGSGTSTGSSTGGSGSTSGGGKSSGASAA